MKLEDPTRAATFVVRLVGEPKVGKTSLTAALMDLPIATDEELARLSFDEEGTALEPAGAVVAVVRGLPEADSRALVSRAAALAVGSARGSAGSTSLFVAVNACDLGTTPEAELREAWA